MEMKKTVKLSQNKVLLFVSTGCFDNATVGDLFYMRLRVVCLLCIPQEAKNRIMLGYIYAAGLQMIINIIYLFIVLY